MYNIESLLSARLFLSPQIHRKRIYFLSNLSGRLSLYAMDHGGSVPEPLLPPNIALQNPHLIQGYPFYVFPKLGKILVIIDNDGDEHYQPMIIPIDGGYPEPIFKEQLWDFNVHLLHCDSDAYLVYFSAESRQEQLTHAYQGNLKTGELLLLDKSKWGSYVDSINREHNKAVLIDSYTSGDHVLYLWNQDHQERQLLYGTPLEERTPEQTIPLNAIFSSNFCSNNKGIVFVTALFEDNFGLGYLDLSHPSEVIPVRITGLMHKGVGELNALIHTSDHRYFVVYNINGCSWVYEGILDEENLHLRLEHVLVGQGELSNGVLEFIFYDRSGDRYALSFSTATSPTQIFTIEGKERNKIVRHTNERLLGIPSKYLSPGEDASFTSFDETYISARLYLPAPTLGYKAPYPLIYYIHGGPQSQERPDFAWFSMPLIQFLTLNGFAVFVPNVRGSSGYGLNYMKQVDHDWGGKDRLDHVYAMQKVLPNDQRLDVSQVGVVGRSYGGYMTLTLVGRHPELWSAAVDMFGPYDLLTFMDRIPETWKPYFAIAVGDPEKESEFLVERSPRNYLHQLSCPLLVVQGKNDPRVVERESLDLVENLRALGKQVEYLMFEDEGHDILKYDNRVKVYTTITDFFKQHLRK